MSKQGENGDGDVLCKDIKSLCGHHVLNEDVLGRDVLNGNVLGKDIKSLCGHHVLDGDVLVLLLPLRIEQFWVIIKGITPYILVYILSRFVLISGGSKNPITP